MTSSNYIAQMNMGYLLHPHGDPRISEFELNSYRVNAAAERSKGFVWRLRDTGNLGPENDTGKLFGRPNVALATLSVWESYLDFERFVHNTIHSRFLDRRGEWFEHVKTATSVIWPVTETHIPCLSEGKDRLVMLQINGPTDEAYDFVYGNKKYGQG